MTRFRERYPSGVPCCIDTSHPDPAAVASFYAAVLGWTFPSLEGPYLVGLLGGGAVAGIRAGSPTGWVTYVSVESAEDAAERAFEAGGRVVEPPYAAGDAGVAAGLRDPAGSYFRVWEPRGFAGAQVVNADGAWNWSTLEAPASVEPFYASLFGWSFTTSAFGTTIGAPGYGDFLDAEVEPGLRDRLASDGAPEGFADVVAWRTDGPGRWTVTFATDDPDRVAEAALAHGGEVLAAPHDVGPVRAATLRDPFGAEFSVNRYQPARSEP